MKPNWKVTWIDPKTEGRVSLEMKAKEGLHFIVKTYNSHLPEEHPDVAKVTLGGFKLEYAAQQVFKELASPHLSAMEKERLNGYI